MDLSPDHFPADRPAHLRNEHPLIETALKYQGHNLSSPGRLDWATMMSEALGVERPEGSSPFWTPEQVCAWLLSIGMVAIRSGQCRAGDVVVSDFGSGWASVTIATSDRMGTGICPSSTFSHRWMSGALNHKRGVFRLPLEARLAA